MRRRARRPRGPRARAALRLAAPDASAPAGGGDRRDAPRRGLHATARRRRLAVPVRRARLEACSVPQAHRPAATVAAPADPALRLAELRRRCRRDTGACSSGAATGSRPLGDDVLCGWLALHRAAGVDDPRGRRAGRARACRARTTLLSATLLDCALHGEVLPEFAACVAALGTPRGAAAAAALAAVGAHLGRGLLARRRRRAGSTSPPARSAPHDHPEPRPRRAPARRLRRLGRRCSRSAAPSRASPASWPPRWRWRRRSTSRCSAEMGFDVPAGATPQRHGRGAPARPTTPTWSRRWPRSTPP